MSDAVALRPLDAATYITHPLHAAERIWAETNCYVDLWIEVLHSFGFDPRAGLSFLLGADFDGEQWEFLKFPIDDLRVLYGIDVSEINVWRPIEDHIVEHLVLGHLTTVEVDAWFLPDTAGSSYRFQHQKTTIAPQMVDRDGRRLGYFHNRSYFELGGDDYVGTMRLAAEPSSLVPYVERISFDRVRPLAGDELRAGAASLGRAHLARRPSTNPVERMARRITSDLHAIAEGGQDQFHLYAFGTMRQCGAWAELLGDHLRWLGGEQLAASATAFTRLAEVAKTAQFKLARVAAGRSADLGPLFSEMAELWTSGYDLLDSLPG